MTDAQTKGEMMNTRYLKPHGTPLTDDQFRTVLNARLNDRCDSCGKVADVLVYKFTETIQYAAPVTVAICYCTGCIEE
jgi:hypothetical protein